MDKSHGLASSRYVPNDQSILRSYACTLGIQEEVFDSPWLKSVFDVGGSRTQRKKLLLVCEGTHCLAFVAALSGYDTCLYEDKTAVRDVREIISFSPFLRSLLMI